MNVNLMFVDDDVMLLAGIRRQLRGKFSQVTTEFCNSGEAALQAARVQVPDIIFSDYHMPGMDGVELLSRFKERFPSAFRVAMTGELDLANCVPLLAVAQQLVGKPCGTGQLIELINGFVELRRLKKANG